VCGCGSGERVALKRGDASAEAGEFATAILHYTEAIDLDPSLDVPSSSRGKQAIAEPRGDGEDVLKSSSLEPDLGN
jgi:hypothetical protein